MSLEAFIATYGYLALIVGTLLEGETVVIIAGVLARRGYLELPWVIICSLAGAVAGDQFFFHLGRKSGPAFLARRPHWQRRVDRVRRLLERYQTPVIIGFRFLYGLRSVTPFAIGASGYSPLRFLILNAIGGIIWAGVVGYAGYTFGLLLETIISDIEKYELWIVIGIAVAACALWLIRSRRWKHAVSKGQKAD